MSKNLVHLHVMIDKKDFELMDAFCSSHGDMSKIIRHLTHKFCKELKKGGVRQKLPPELIANMGAYQQEDGDDNV